MIKTFVIINDNFLFFETDVNLVNYGNAKMFKCVKIKVAKGYLSLLLGA